MVRLTNIITKKSAVKTAAGSRRAQSSARHVSPRPIESNQRYSV